MFNVFLESQKHVLYAPTEDESCHDADTRVIHSKDNSTGSLKIQCWANSTFGVETLSRSLM